MLKGENKGSKKSEGKKWSFWLIFIEIDGLWIKNEFRRILINFWITFSLLEVKLAEFQQKVDFFDKDHL